MTKELRRLSVVLLFMFLALFAATSWIQVVHVDTLAQHERNTRTLYDSYLIQRGAIIAGDATLASSAPVDDPFSFQRVYGEADIWAPVTGFFNPALQSATGIEQAMNADLAGTGANAFFATIERLLSGQPQRGSNVLLTLDPVVQRAAMEALAGYEGAVVAIEPATGRLLALASTPGFDTNLLAVHDAEEAEAVYTALEQDPANPLYNRAVAGGLNPPGSTFKILVAAAAYDSGDFTPDSTLPNPAAYTLPGTTTAIHNAWGGACGDGETVTIAEALRLSCNIPFAQLAVALGDDRIREMAERFGFNQELSFPLDVTPSVYPRGLDDPQTALTGFGQGQVIATPLQMAMVTAGIANDGLVMNPRMIDSVLGNDLSVQRAYEDTEFGRAFDAQVADDVTRSMVASVETGAAQGARIDGIAVAGKTGTAENGDGPYTLWFTGFAPAENPRVAVAVVVENGGGQGQSGSGDGIASPVAKKVIEAVLGR